MKGSFHSNIKMLPLKWKTAFFHTEIGFHKQKNIFIAL